MGTCSRHIFMKKESIFIYVSLYFTYTHISKWVERKGGFMDNFAFYSPTYFAFGKGEEMKAGGAHVYEKY